MRSGISKLLFFFEDFGLDCDRRELRRGNELLSVEPQVFDLLQYLIRNRDRVVSKDDLIAAVWQGRIVSEATLGSRINAVRAALHDSGEEQHLIRTVLRKGVRFVVPVIIPHTRYHQTQWAGRCFSPCFTPLVSLMGGRRALWVTVKGFRLHPSSFPGLTLTEVGRMDDASSSIWRGSTGSRSRPRR